MQGIKQLKMNDAPLQLTNNISEANALLALQSKLKKNPRIQATAKSHDIPIYVTKVIFIQNCFIQLDSYTLSYIFANHYPPPCQTSSLEQVTKAIRALVSDHEDGLKDFVSVDKIKQSEKVDALEVI